MTKTMLIRGETYQVKWTKSEADGSGLICGRKWKTTAIMRPQGYLIGAWGEHKAYRFESTEWAQRIS